MSDNVCNDCPIRLFNTKCYNLQGVGNIFARNCIILPNVDYPAYKNANLGFSNQVGIIEHIISSTGEVTEGCYVTPLIHCNLTISCEINDSIINRCLTYTTKLFKEHHFNNVLLLGEAVKYFLHIDSIKPYINNVIISKNNIKYFVNYNPLVKFTNKELYETFISNLQLWWSSVNSNDFSMYKPIYV